MKQQDAPGTTFRKHNEIAKGLLSEDDYLLSEILMSPYSLQQIENVRDKLNQLIELIKAGDPTPFNELFDQLRTNIGMSSSSTGVDK